MEQVTHTFENAQFVAEVDEQPDCRVSVRVTIKPAAVKKAHQQAVKQVNKQISVPGFRKGKAPDSTVVSRYGSYVEREWKEALMKEAYFAAVELTKMKPIRSNSVESAKIEKCSQEEGAVISLVYEHFPQLPQIDFSSITLPDVPQEAVTEEEINDVIEQSRSMHADWEKQEGRPVVLGDFVDITVLSLEDRENPKALVTDKRFEVSEKSMPSWMRTLLLGMQVGESGEGESDNNDAAGKESKQEFHATPVRLTLHAIFKRVPPLLNDEFARKVGVGSIALLREHVQKNLEEGAQTAQEEKLLGALDQQLLERVSFSLPRTLVASQKQEQIRQQKEQVEHLDLPAAEKQGRLEALEKHAEQEVERGLRLHFIYNKVLEQGQIRCTPEELSAEVRNYMARNPELWLQREQLLRSEQFISRIASLVLRKKAQKYALSQAQKGRANLLDHE